MESTVSLYVRTALEEKTQIPAYTIDLASRQRRLGAGRCGWVTKTCHDAPGGKMRKKVVDEKSGGSGMVAKKTKKSKLQT